MHTYTYTYIHTYIHTYTRGLLYRYTQYIALFEILLCIIHQMLIFRGMTKQAKNGMYAFGRTYCTYTYIRTYICTCIYIYKTTSQPRYPIWSSGQDSWLSPRRPGFDSRNGKLLLFIAVIHCNNTHPHKLHMFRKRYFSWSVFMIFMFCNFLCFPIDL